MPNEIGGEKNVKLSYPPMQYNLTWDNNKPNRKQYFGLSNISGVDLDMFTYKGVLAYDDEPSFLTHSFHLDCRTDLSNYEKTDFNNGVIRIFVDGDDRYIFDAVSKENTNSYYNEIPTIKKKKK